MTRSVVTVCADWPIHAAFGTDGVDDADRTDTGTARPAAVFSPRGIVATNAGARDAGVRAGLRRRDAQRRCPELLLIAEDPARDARTFEPVVATLGTLTPQVEIVEPGTALFATRGPSRYFGGDVALARRAHHLVTATLDGRTTVRIGIADGPLIAQLAAAGAAGDPIRVVPPGAARSFVAPIPLSALARFAPDPGVLATCRQLGLSTLGEVATLPRASVTGRFGPDGVWLHRLAHGDDPTVFSPTPVPPETDEAVGFDPPETRAEAVAFVVRGAAGIFADRLARSGLACDTVVITLETDHGERLERRWRLDGPGRIAERSRPVPVLIAERARWQMDGWLSGSAATRPSAGVVRVTLTPGRVHPARGTQTGFWGGISAADERAGRAVARLEALVGPDAVHRIELRGARDPDGEATLVPVSAPSADTGTDTGTGTGAVPARQGRGTGRPGPSAPWPGRLPVPSPTVVLDPPCPAEVSDDSGADVRVSGRGELCSDPTVVRIIPDGRPGSGRPVPIASWTGPWPVDERWWDPTGHHRHARLQIVTDEGVALLVTRRDRRWWLTAIYT